MSSFEQAPGKEQGARLLELLLQSLEQWQKVSSRPDAVACAAFLHGQIYGLATALRLFFPGPGNLGEQAALALRPLLTQHHCDCAPANKKGDL
ncbi:hypothetical protein [Desulfotomaculum copahuensis]|uniref:Uncharacterized protein n=1 Tax=Desulfotomaculum copahuensis TaxID=1838280 RepID=A0A1B7LE58_9FIRM|nr:hypothetical protein [Desulfotomaculum copahuensis]OAT81335.1 hypothetical protein A6M21_10660 [Desulfotomaculum copahuensis]